MGGISPEFDISILSGEEIIRHLDPMKYIIKPFVLTREGFLSIKGFLYNSGSFSYKKEKFFLLNNTELLSYLKEVDVIYNTIHGPTGEDGQIQGFLSILKIPYTGASVGGSAVTINKLYSKLIAKEIGIDVPNYITITYKQFKSKNYYRKITELNSDKIVIKPIKFGSSVGISIVKVMENRMFSAIMNSFKISDTLLIEEYISGIEITVPVIGRKYSIPLSPIEIVPIKSSFFDYYAKYDSKATYEIIPARLENEINFRAQKIALNLHKFFQLSGASRTDMIFDSKTNRIFYLETNTTPGMTKNSLVPKSAQFFGLSYSKLLDIIIQDALYGDNIIF